MNIHRLAGLVALALGLAGCAGPPGTGARYGAGTGYGAGDDAAPPARAVASWACNGSGFPAIGSVAAPGVPCTAVENMYGGPPAPPDRD